MKHVVTTLIFIHIPLTLALATQPLCEIQADCKWQDLDTYASLHNESTFGGKWILAATITFKNKGTETLYLDELDLEWQGEKLEKLNATLFRCDPYRPFMPLEEHVIADGTWSNQYQRLQFSFKEKERLQPTHTFALVLTVPSETEPSIKGGHFMLIPKTLPQPLQQSAQQKPLYVYTSLPHKNYFYQQDT